jgi:hypothetical protein
VYLHSNDNYFLWPILVFRGVPRTQLLNMYLHPKEALARYAQARQLFFLAHFSIEKCPFCAALEHVSQSQGHLFSLAHFGVSKCPPKAAKEHVFSFQGQFFFLAHFSISKCPPKAAKEHVSSFQSQPFSLDHFNIAR